MDNQPFFNTLTGEYLNTLNTRNLLAYYKAERDRFYKKRAGYVCDCCRSFSWEIYSKTYSFEEKQFEQWEHYLKFIKEILSKREHINVRLDRPKKRKTNCRRRVHRENN